MDKELFKEYLENRYKDQMKYYDGSAGKNQKKYKQFQWTLIILSASTPILAALIQRWPQLQLVVVVISAIVAILTAGLKTFQYQELWVTYRTTMEQLKPEYHYYSFGVGPYAEEGIDKEMLFVSRVETILDKEHVGWPQTKRQPDNGQAPKAETTSEETKTE